MKRRTSSIVENDHHKLRIGNLKEEYQKLNQKTFTKITEDSINFYLKFGFVHFRLEDDDEDIHVVMEQHRKNIQAHLHAYQLSDHDLMNHNNDERRVHLNKIKKSKLFPYKLNIGWILGTEYQIQEEEEEEETKNSLTYGDSGISKINLRFEEEKTMDYFLPPNQQGGEGGGKKSFYDYIAQSKHAWMLREKCFPWYKKFYDQMMRREERGGGGGKEMRLDDDDNNEKEPSYFHQKDWFASIEHSHFLFNNIKFKENTIQEADQLHFFPGIFKNKKTFNDDLQKNKMPLSSEERLKYPRGFLFCGKTSSKVFGLVPGLSNSTMFKELIESLPEKEESDDNDNDKDKDKDEEEERKKNSPPSSSYFDKRTLVRAIPPKELELEKFVINLEMKPGDYVIYSPAIPTRFDQNFNSAEEDHFYGINIMFMRKDYMFRNFDDTLKEYLFNQRRIAFVSKQVLNNERLFGHMIGSVCEKKRGKKYICKIKTKKTVSTEFNSYVYHYKKLLNSLVL